MSVSPLADTIPPTAEPAVAIPDERIPYRPPPVVFGAVPVTEELREAIERVDAALVVARLNQPGVVFTDLAGAVRRVGADA
jgi:hypothetical protein